MYHHTKLEVEQMTSDWHHHKEARDYAISLKDKRARAALRGVHSLLLESSGAIPLHFLERQLRPKCPLDLRVLYPCIARLFSDWTETPRGFSLPEKENLRQFNEAKKYISRLSSEREKVAQSNFIGILCEATLQGDEAIDLMFCCELLHPILSDDRVLDAILSGEAEDHAIHLSQNEEAWDRLWRQDDIS